MERKFGKKDYICKDCKRKFDWYIIYTPITKGIIYKSQTSEHVRSCTDTLKEYIVTLNCPNCHCLETVSFPKVNL